VYILVFQLVVKGMLINNIGNNTRHHAWKHQVKDHIALLVISSASIAKVKGVRVMPVRKPGHPAQDDQAGIKCRQLKHAGKE
jgi:hypothetical protein